MFEACADLVQKIQEFEREASDSKRLRGSSIKLLQEEQQRLRFRKRKEKLVEDLVNKIRVWEGAAGERFLHKGVPIKEVLLQDLEDTKEFGNLSLVSSPQQPTSILTVKEAAKVSTTPGTPAPVLRTAPAPMSP